MSTEIKLNNRKVGQAKEFKGLKGVGFYDSQNALICCTNNDSSRIKKIPLKVRYMLNYYPALNSIKSGLFLFFQLNHRVKPN